MEVDLIVQGIWGSEKSANGDCVEKKGAKGQLRATCKPSVASASILDYGNPLSISSIKALKTPKLDKDSWSFKGAVKGVDDLLEFLLAGGIDLYFPASSQGDNDRVIFDADECKLIRKGTGARCHTKGARFTMMEVRTRFPPYPSCSVTFPFIPYCNFPCADHLFSRPPPHPVTGHGREQWFDLLQGLRRRSPPRVA